MTEVFMFLIYASIHVHHAVHHAVHHLIVKCCFPLLDQKLWTRIHMDGYKPAERSGHTAVAHEGMMYVFGGQQEGNYFNDLFLFNTSTCKLLVISYLIHLSNCINYSQYTAKMGAIELQQ
jgi:hypothetical protein